MAATATDELRATQSRATTRGRRALREVAPALLVALLLRFALIALVPVVPGWDGVLYLRGADQLAAGRGYTQQMLDETAEYKASAFFPPGMPAAFAALRIVGLGSRADLAMQALASALLVVVAWALGRRLGGRRAGRVAAWLIALHPGGVLFSLSYFAEPLFALGIGFGLLPLLYARRRNQLRWLLVMGLAFGVVAYVRSTSLVMVPLVAAGVAWLRWRSVGWRRRVVTTGAWALLALSCAILPLVPWAIRNARTLGEPVLVSTNGGLNLLLGTFAEGGYDSMPAGENAPMGLREVDADRWRNVRARERISADVPSWLARGLLKLGHTFGYEQGPAQYVEQVNRLPAATGRRFSLFALGVSRLYWIALLSLVLVGAARRIASWRGARLRGGVAGMTQSGPRPLRADVIALAPVLGLAALHFVYIGGDRYHAAVTPMLAALAALGFAAVLPPRAHPLQSASASGK